MIKKLFPFLVIINFQVFSSDFFFNTTNNHGSLGLINIPSARFYDSPSGFISFYRGNPDRKITLSMYPYDWLETSIFYSSLSNREYGSGFTQDYKDKGFNLKIRLKDEDNLPALAIGAYDIAGTGFYSSEYIVSSYSLSNFDFHFGAGWGRLNHFNHKKNPLINLNKKFKQRGSDLDEGGKLNTNNLFSGEGISFFGGINYALNGKIIIKAELDPLQTPGRIGYKDRKSDLSLGLSFLTENLIYGINFERGSNFSFNFAFRDNFLVKKKEYKKPKIRSANEYLNLIKTLQTNNVGVSELKLNQEKTYLSLTQYSHNYKDLNTIVEKSISDSGLKEEVVLSYKVAGLEVIEYEHEVPQNSSKIIYQNTFRGLNHGFETVLRPFIAGREDFLKLAFLLEHNSEYIFNENLFFSTNIKLSLADNFDDLIFPPVDTYPAQVRSDIKKYLNNLGEHPTIGRAQLDFFKTISKNNHILLSGGIYEEMFMGYGIDYLNYIPTRHFNWGFEVHKAYKRNYKMLFDLQDYQNITYHYNFYYKNRTIVPFDVKISYGEYLAGDKGVTIDFSRKFKGGVKMGLFASLTDVTSEQFGEGSFDKGIYFSIPFGRDKKITNFLWRPLTKDPASKLIRKNNVYGLVDNYSVY